MNDAATVTFGGSALDRAAELRGEAGALADAVARGGAETVVLWRGKPLVSAPGLDRLLRLRPDHPALSGAAQGPVLLGREDDGTLVMACDISGWAPATGDTGAVGGLADTSEQRHPALSEDHSLVDMRRVMTRLSPRDAELAATARALFGWHETHRFCARCGAESRMIMAGWQRSCDVCGGQHFPRTDPVAIMLITRANRTLLGRSPGWPEGMYSCLAGFVEPGETVEAAVRREVLEEAGIRVGRVSYLASQPWPFPASLMLGCRGEALDDDIRLDPVELEDALWVSREEAMRSMAGLTPGLMPARKGSIAHFLICRWLADRLG